MLNLQSAMPLYAQLREILRADIEKGVWKVGEAIPPEQDLVSQYQVARSTVRQAIMDLVNEGLLYRKQGKGTFVCRNRRLDAMEPLLSFSAEMVSRGVTPQARILKQGLTWEIPPQAEALMENHPVYHLLRLRYADEVPLALEYSYFDTEVLPDLEQENLEGSLYQLLVYGRRLQITKVEQAIGSAHPDAEQAEILNMGPTETVLLLERTMYCEGKPFYWLRFIYRGDLYRFYSVLEGMPR
ncbi:MAG: GntR family transcriptional regulator [Methylocystaceae bacterium]